MPKIAICTFPPYRIVSLVADASGYITEFLFQYLLRNKLKYNSVPLDIGEGYENLYIESHQSIHPYKI